MTIEKLEATAAFLLILAGCGATPGEADRVVLVPIAAGCNPIC